MNGGETDRTALGYTPIGQYPVRVRLACPHPGCEWETVDVPYDDREVLMPAYASHAATHEPVKTRPLAISHEVRGGDDTDGN